MSGRTSRHQRRPTSCEQCFQVVYIYNAHAQFTLPLGSLLFPAPWNVSNSLKLKAIHRFTSTATAVEEITALQEQKVSKSLKKFLSEEVVGKGKSKETLAVFETGLGA